MTRIDNKKNASFTVVDLVWIKGVHEQWLRFGNPCFSKRSDRHSRMVGFGKGETFALVRWAGNDYGTVLSRIDIIQTVAADEPCQSLPFMRPGGEILLRTHGLEKVGLVLDLIDAIEKSGVKPVDVCDDYWRHVHNRIAARKAPHPYGKDQHQAWLKRRRIGL
ncbi:DUF2840 domain-containing protein [uncultured Bartonella sp.]|uniref:DUF2840 domain-containing protein n=1 Tax=uncultured Bartonella sp. TaxID=104108 RepID=UPI002630D504|nr:DUF2840 domain-containing protein [uncultured Bartonella sp.]